MFRTRMIPLIAALLLILPFGAAAAEVESGSVYCFSSQDFAGESEGLAGIFVTELPGNAGTVMLGSRVVRPGDILTADQLSQMTFSPVNTETDGSAELGYLPIFQDRVETEAVMSLAIRGKENQPPVAEDSAMETYKNLENTGTLKVKDPEGETLTFTIVRQPKRGTVTVAEDGSFTYTPKKNKVGIDSFTYTATDPAGKVSREATVTVTILKPTDSTQYSDTAGKSCCFAAEWMRHTGIFTGENLAGNPCFSPERTVSRGEFITMLVRALEIPVDEEVTVTGYEEGVPDWLKPYLAAAARSGITSAVPMGETFDADAPMGSGEAAAMLCGALGISVNVPGDAVETSAEGDGIPAWESAALEKAREAGIPLEPGTVLTRGQAAEILYAAAAQNTQSGRIEIWK